ncbi:MAG: glycoside hydrolase family 26 protein [Oscillospiraceae bacterium]|nr:glycoside hydrolase family 26 protein [Oscillospiraceae bacterium]
MKRLALILMVFLVMSSACSTEISYPDEPPVFTTAAITDKPPVEHPVFTERRVHDFGIVYRPFFVEIDMVSEFPDKKSDGLSDILNDDDKDYIKLLSGESISYQIDTPSSQHYILEVEIFGDNSALGVYSASQHLEANELFSATLLEHGAFYSGGTQKFETKTMESIFLRDRANTVVLKAIRGDVYICALKITAAELSERRYDITPSPADINASEKTRVVLEYLADIYGRHVLTAQHCTVNTNVEINAIYEATGRYPAIRAGDMVNYSRCYGGADKKDNREIELSEQWADNGGLVMLSWTWFSPMPTGGSHYYAADTAFDINAAVTRQDLLSADTVELEALNEFGKISDETLELMKDIDDMARHLKQLSERDIPVLWRPLKQPELKWFWWGAGEPESYIYVWRLMFERFHLYHELDNLIWVWASENSRYYPGDNYVDIIGVDCYNLTDTSNVVRLDAAQNIPSAKKMTAMSESGLLPNPDILHRDNAMWLFTGLFKGDFLVGDNGLHASALNLKDRLEYIYNHELTVALDEVIRF